MTDLKYYKKTTDTDTYVKIVDANGNYSVASANDPEPDGYTHTPDKDMSGWEPITSEEVESILGWHPED